MPSRRAADPGSAKARLQAIDEERVFEMLAESRSVRRIANILGVSASSLDRWLKRSAHARARTMAARQMAFIVLDEEAERALLAAGDDLVKLQRAKLLAHHLRWRASKLAHRNPPTGATIDLLAALRDLDRSVLATEDYLDA